MVTTDLVNFKLIQDAAQKISPYIRHTPIMHANKVRFDAPYDYDLFFKLELHQLSGSFKVRGTTNKILSMTPEQLQNGIVTASGGNHGRAVAYIGKKLSIPTTVYLPKSTPQNKIDSIAKYNPEIIMDGEDLNEANELAKSVAEASNRGFIHPYNDPAVINGQGTLGIEILDQIKDVDVLIMAIGGGGLIGGVGTVAKHINPNIKIYGVEPTGCPTMHESLKANKIIKVDKITTKVGTLAIRQTSELNFNIAKKVVDDIILVSDDDMQYASDWLWWEFGIAAELSGAASMAGLLSNQLSIPKTAKVCALICGLGNEGTSKY